MGHEHTHEIEGQGVGARLGLTVALNLLITGLELVGGTISGSLSLQSDALHNLSDGVSLIIAWVAARIAGRPRSSTYTFGFKRARIIAAIVNAAILVGISVFLFREAYDRFLHPALIEGRIMLLVAVAGLLANVAGTLLLHKGSKEDMNLRAGYLHLLSDSISSVGVIVGAVVIEVWHVTWVDPVLTVIIAAYVLKEGMMIVADGTAILMMRAPSHVDLNVVAAKLEELEGVESIHHVHVWNLDEHDRHFEAHVRVRDMLVSDAMTVLRQAEALLNGELGFTHATLQLETDRGHAADLIATSPGEPANETQRPALEGEPQEPQQRPLCASLA